MRCDPAPCQPREQPGGLRHACSGSGAGAASRYQNIPPCAAEGGGRLRQPEKRAVPRGLSPCLAFAAAAPLARCSSNCGPKRPVAEERWGSLVLVLPFFVSLRVEPRYVARAVPAPWRRLRVPPGPRPAVPRAAAAIGNPAPSSCCPPCCSRTLTRGLRL